MASSCPLFGLAFTGGPLRVYRQGVIGVFLMALAVPAFFFGTLFSRSAGGARALHRSRVTSGAASVMARIKHFPGDWNKSV